MRIYSPIAFILVALWFCGCSQRSSSANDTPIDTMQVMVMRAKECSRLYTTEYHIHKIITHSDTSKVNGRIMQHDISLPLPMAARNIAIPMDATLKAYIDMGEITEDNFKRNGKKITLILPDPKVTVTSTKINHAEIKKHVALLGGRFSDAELQRYALQGRKQIINFIPQTGIIEDARENAANTLIPMIAALGYEPQNITITFRKDLSAKEIINLTTIENTSKQ